MGPIGCPKTSVRNYHYSLRNKPEERSSRTLRGGSLKSRIKFKRLQRMGIVENLYTRLFSMVSDEMQWAREKYVCMYVLLLLLLLLLL
jgi:hypothetical protein